MRQPSLVFGSISAASVIVFEAIEIPLVAAIVPIFAVVI